MGVGAVERGAQEIHTFYRSDYVEVVPSRREFLVFWDFFEVTGSSVSRVDQRVLSWPASALYEYQP
jgi:hypothetical protein